MKPQRTEKSSIYLTDSSTGEVWVCQQSGGVKGHRATTRSAEEPGVGNQFPQLQWLLCMILCMEQEPEWVYLTWIDARTTEGLLAQPDW